MNDTATFALMGDLPQSGGYWSGLIVPAVILMFGVLLSATILVATRLRQNRFDAELRNESNQLDKERQTVSKIFWVLDRDITPENIEKNYDEILHYAWMLTQPVYADLTRKIRDFDRAKLKDFDAAMEELQRLKREAKTYLEE